MLFCKEAPLLNIISNENNLSICVDSLLHEFKDLFPKEVPSGLPPIIGIKHRINLNPRASFPNRTTYRSNPQQTQEIQRQVVELVSKGWVRENISPCAVPIILVPTKDGTRRIVGMLITSPLSIFVVLYFNDILIYRKKLEDHCTHLRVILQVLRQKFICNFFFKKCLFHRSCDFLKFHCKL